MPSLPPAKKSLGQCFLVDNSYAKQTVHALNLKAGETVIEIGPGRGILTEELLKTDAKVIAVEIDQRLLELLREKFGHKPNFTLRHEDFLQSRLDTIVPSGNYKIAGNLPYHLASEVLYKLFAHARIARTNDSMPWVESTVLMMQKEVADRVASKPGSKVWGKLSVFTQIEANTYSVLTVPAEAFRPEPKVAGGVIRLDFYRLPPFYPEDFAIFERIVRYCFHQRRKMLKTSLSTLAGIHPFWQRADLDFTRRPETLTPEEWVQLARTIAEHKSRKE